jgi:hypothetical protein
MKRLNFVIISTILGSLLTTSPFILQAKAFAVSTPAPIFRPIPRNIQNQIPRGMVMRLSSSFPAPPRAISGYRPEITSSEDGYFAIIFATANCPQTPATSICDTGRIFVARRGSNAEQWLQEAKQKGERVQLVSRVFGFYYSDIQPTRGQRQKIMWEQDGMIYGVISRSMSQTEVISVATSMASSTPIKSIRQ